MRNINHAKIKKILKQKRRWKRKKKIRNKLSNRPSKVRRYRALKYAKNSSLYFQQPQKHRISKITVPADFSLLTNLDLVIKFFADCKKFNKGICDVVEFDFSNVKNIGSGAITILLSICGWLNDHDINIRGSYPEDPETRTRFEKLGFLRYFNASYQNKLNSNSRSEIVQRGLNTTNPGLTASKIRDAMETTFSVKSKNTKIQGMLIELMANTVNHAYNKNQKGWYLALDHNEEEKVVRFSFVDNGEGILNTIKIRFKDIVSKVFGLSDDGQILRQAFDGKFGSRTKLSYRGRGLPLVKKNFENGFIKKLVVISNGVYYDFTTETCQILNTEFEGTFYFWELNEECKILTYGN